MTRSNGITHAVIAPQTDGDGVIAGQAALVNFDGWTVEEMAVDPSIAMVVSWPAIRTRRFDFSTFSMVETPFNEAKEKAEEQVNELRDWLEAARHYRQAMQSGSSRLDPNLRLAGLAECLDGGKRMIMLANNKRDIEAAVEFAEDENLDIILGGGRDAWKVKEMLAEKGIPVILGLTQSMPNEEDDPYDRPFRNAGDLAAAGVKIALASGAGGGFGPGGPHGSRTTMYEAAMAAAYGLSRDDALKAMTLWPAEMLGVSDILGTIELHHSSGTLSVDLREGHAGKVSSGNLFWCIDCSGKERFSLKARDIFHYSATVSGTVMELVVQGIRPPDDGDGSTLDIRFVYHNGCQVYGNFGSSVEGSELPTSDTPVKLTSIVFDFMCVKDTLASIGIFDD